jgi:hypothetical protein
VGDELLSTRRDAYGNSVAVGGAMDSTLAIAALALWAADRVDGTL